MKITVLALLLVCGAIGLIVSWGTPAAPFCAIMLVINAFAFGVNLMAFLEGPR